MGIRGKCIVCKKEAVVRVDYARVYFCSVHFDKHFVKKVERTIKAHKMFRKGDRILVGVSGGKDSIALLHVLKRLQKKFQYELLPLFIDLGIGNFSQESREICEKICEQLSLELTVVSLRAEYGFSLRDAVRLTKRPPCSVCGLIKRHILSEYSIELKASKIATGHTLVDEAAFLFNILAQPDLLLLLKRSPVVPSLGNLPPKVKPLYRVYDYETQAYVTIHKLDYVKSKCPYSIGATSLKTKSILELIEAAKPGYLLNFIKGWYKVILPAICQDTKSGMKVLRCAECGLPARSEICSFCRLLKLVKRKMREEVEVS
ncbi:MAG: hypothetical protein DRJ52_03505 [Thermoprotei archaeon]|nr:MAG: hypothetical protein DRJ52_03505 [Thermoprotei archaeon]RLE99825.1 MAG: hypothetical protein DRJ63_04120 [Thermoprotei archaeon]